MASQLKKYAISVVARSGIDRLAISLHRRDALVLVYHAILKEAKGEPFRYHHTVAEFEAHLDWLGANCAPATLSEFARWRHGDWSPRKPPVLLTFDDGYLNNATTAAPLLTRKGFPAAFFIATGYIGRAQVLWPDEVFARVCAWPEASIDDPDGATLVMPAAPERQSFALSLVEACKNCTDLRRREFIAYLEARTPHCDPLQDRDVQAFMSWDDVRTLAAAGFDLGSHSVTHPVLSNLSVGEVRQELRDSRAAIEAESGVQCKALTYPNGRARDIGQVVVAEAARAGYEFAFTVSNRWCGRAGDSLQIDRMSPPGHSELATFALHASGFRQWIRN